MSTQKTLICVGECMVEMAPAEGGTFGMGFAGDTFNTAWYARKLMPQDWRVGYVTRVGEDATSASMLEFMTSFGIDVEGIGRMQDRTVGLYMIQLENGERSFSYWRGQSAARCLADDPEWLEQELGKADILFFSGITLGILDGAARGRFCRVVSKLRAKGVQTVFDTNMRPRLWADEPSMRDGIMQGAEGADIVLPSLDEEQAFFGDKTAQQVAARYHGAGATLVVVKNGPGEGLVSSKNGESFTFTPNPAPHVVDTTAAGDSFDAGFLAALASGQDLPAAVRRGAELAAKVVQARGALVDLG